MHTGNGHRLNPSKVYDRKVGPPSLEKSSRNNMKMVEILRENKFKNQ